MLGQAEQFLIGEKPAESGRIPFILALLPLDGLPVNPVNALDHWEQLFEQGVMAAEGNIDAAITHAWTGLSIENLVKSVHDRSSTLFIFKLSVTHHGPP